MKTIKAFAPATIANVSCGFDVFGLALQQPGDEVELTLNDSGKVIIKEITGDGGVLPREASDNTAGVAVIEFLKSLKSRYGAEIILHKKLPLGSGMGSSAASAAAALVAVNHALGNPLERRALIPYAMEAERMACGSAHADNVAPALLGGFVLIRNHKQLDFINIPVPPGLVCVLVHPHIEINTRDARMALKKTIALSDAVTQWGNTAALVAGLIKQDYALIGRAMEDVVAEPIRAIFIPAFETIKHSALEAGALGCSISGSGPSLFALCKGNEMARVVAEAMQKKVAQAGLTSEYYISSINPRGARVLNGVKPLEV
jgi:homoserine kinase